MTTFPRPLIAAVVSLSMLAACGGNNSVGSKGLLDIKGQASKDCGQLNGPQCTTTTTSPKSTTTVTAKAALGASTTSTTSAAQQQAQQQQREQAAAAATVEVAIQADSSGAQFVPSAVRAYKGSFIKWVNKDSKTRSVESDDAQTFVSPPIPPGGSWTYTANTVGFIQYHDATRPYATATLEVLKR